MTNIGQQNNRTYQLGDIDLIGIVWINGMLATVICMHKQKWHDNTASKANSLARRRPKKGVQHNVGLLPLSIASRDKAP